MKRKVITQNTLPERKCPICGDQVIKVIRMGQLSYECPLHWGPWNAAIKVKQ